MAALGATQLVAQQGAVRPQGNLSLGQALEHIARTLHASLDGFGFSVPPEVQEVGRAHKEAILSNPMRAGIKLPAAGEERGDIGVGGEAR